MAEESKTQKQLRQFSEKVAENLNKTEKQLRDEITEVKNSVTTQPGAQPESTTQPTPVVVVPETTPEKPVTINLFNKDTHGSEVGGRLNGKWRSQWTMADNGALSVTGPIAVKAGIVYRYNVNVNWYDRNNFYVDFSETEIKDATLGTAVKVKKTNGGSDVPVAERYVEFEVEKDGFVRLNIDNASINKLMLAPVDGYPDKFLAYGEVPDGYIQNGKNSSEESKSEAATVAQPETISVSAQFVNRLTGKKWYAYGDSYTEGLSAVEKDDDGVYKSYHWHITKRNGMLGKNCGESGSWLALDESRYNQAFISADAKTNYTQIPADADYITFAFGLNEFNLAADNPGTKSSTDVKTMWGAYNKLFEETLKKNPKVKIGVILMPAWQRKTYRDLVKEICMYWGIPVLDMKDYSKVPMWYANPTVDKDDTLAKARGPRASAFGDSTEHPNAAAHEFMSTFIENFLFSL